jgi:hypothetical protein
VTAKIAALVHVRQTTRRHMQEDGNLRVIVNLQSNTLVLLLSCVLYGCETRSVTHSYQRSLS